MDVVFNQGQNYGSRSNIHLLFTILQFLSIMQLGTLQREDALVKGLGFRVSGPIRQRACATPCSLAITDPVLNLDGYE
jgi:hypothetical protein